MFSQLTKKYIFLVFTFIISINLYSQAKINVYFFVNDSNLSSVDLKKSAQLIYLDNSIKIDNFSIYHFTNKTEENTKWTNKKKIVEYKPTSVDCDFSICNSLNIMISSNKTEKNKLFTFKSNLSCETNKWNIETVNLSNSNDGNVIDKIKEEIAINKEIKKNTSLFFYFSGNENHEKLNVNLEKDIFEIKKNDSLQINPIFSSNVAKIEWSPIDGLSCSNCPKPKISPTKNTIYTISVSDSAKCKTLSKNFTVNVKSNCDCKSGTLKPLKDVLDLESISKYIKEPPSNLSEWKILSNVSGSFVFDFMTSSNCGLKFNVEIYKSSNMMKIWELPYDRSDVDKSADTELHKKFSNNFVFRLPLNKVKSILEDPSETFILKIKSIDETFESCGIYSSPTLTFVKCQ
jgi:hypothetical protein